MKTLVSGIALGLVVGATATALGGTTTKNFYLNRGDSAITSGAETTCTYLRHGGSDGFVCKVGGDYRAKYGVIVNSSEVAITQYAGFDRYRVIVRRRQSPIKQR